MKLLNAFQFWKKQPQEHKDAHVNAYVILNDHVGIYCRYKSDAEKYKEIYPDKEILFRGKTGQWERI